MDKVREQSNISRAAWDRQLGENLAGCSAGDDRRGAAWRLETDDEKQGEDGGRSKRDWLQKASKDLRESHCRIMGVEMGGGEITSRVDLRCDQTAA
jgi:hypothetical protein